MSPSKETTDTPAAPAAQNQPAMSASQRRATVSGAESQQAESKAVGVRSVPHDYMWYTDNYNLARANLEIERQQAKRRASLASSAAPPPQEKKRKVENTPPLANEKDQASKMQGQKNTDDSTRGDAGASAFGFDGSRSPRPGPALRNPDGTFKEAEEDENETTLVADDDSSDSGTATIRGYNSASTKQRVSDFELAQKLQAAEYEKSGYRFDNTRIQIASTSAAERAKIPVSESGYGAGPVEQGDTDSGPIFGLKGLRILPPGFRHTLADQEARARRRQAEQDREAGRPVKPEPTGTESWTARRAAAMAERNKERLKEEKLFGTDRHTEQMMDSFLGFENADRGHTMDLTFKEREHFERERIAYTVERQKALEAAQKLKAKRDAEKKALEKAANDDKLKTENDAAHKEAVRRWEAGADATGNAETAETAEKHADDAAASKTRRYTLGKLVFKDLSGDVKLSYAQKLRRNTVHDPRHPEYMPPASKEDKDSEDKQEDDDEDDDASTQA